MAWKICTSEMSLGSKTPGAKKNKAQKTGAKLNLCYQGTGIPHNDKRAHARVVSHLLIVLLQKLPVFYLRTLSESFKYCLYEESQMYVFSSKYNEI